MTCWGILENLISDLIFLFGALGASWLFITLFRRKRLLDFFGIRSTKRIVIYISNIRVLPFGSIGIDGQKRSYRNPSAAFGEMQSSINLRDHFNYIIPSLSDRPGILNKLLVSDVSVQILHSPLEKAQLDKASTFIAIGSPAFNIASKYIEEDLDSQAIFTLGTIPKQVDSGKDQDTGLTAYSTQGQSEYIRGTTLSLASASPTGEGAINSAEIPSSIIVDDLPPLTDPSYSFVERIYDSQSNRTVFYIAGLSENSTVGAARFLASEWNRISDKYSDDSPFLILLKCDPSIPRKWAIVFEK